MKLGPPQLVLALCCALAACGQKGPLYLPDTKAGEIVTRPTPAPDQEPHPDATPAPVPEPEATPPVAPDESDKDKKNGTPPPR
jgi:predicted small lipoprotein YifL